MTLLFFYMIFPFVKPISSPLSTVYESNVNGDDPNQQTVKPLLLNRQVYQLFTMTK